MPTSSIQDIYLDVGGIYLGFQDIDMNNENDINRIYDLSGYSKNDYNMIKINGYYKMVHK
jgi:hypothetical protein